MTGIYQLQFKQMLLSEGWELVSYSKHNREDQPIAFASKSLTDAETRYANIERELLAIVFACQCFSTYLLGRNFVAESDHKPLQMIAMKNLVKFTTTSSDECCWSYRDTMSSSSIDQARKCNWPTCP